MREGRETLRVLRAQSGDREALDALLRELQGPLFRFIRHLVGNRELAEDVLQDVFVILCRKLTWLRDPKLLRPWTYRIASREALRRLRRENRLRQLDDGGEIEAVSDPEVPDPVRHRLLAQLPRLVATVPPASRAVLVLHYLEELTQPQVAEILGVPLGTVKSRISYGLRLLRRQLSSDLRPERSSL